MIDNLDARHFFAWCNPQQIVTWNAEFSRSCLTHEARVNFYRTTPGDVVRSKAAFVAKTCTQHKYQHQNKLSGQTSSVSVTNNKFHALNQWFLNISAHWAPIKVYNFLQTVALAQQLLTQVCVKINLYFLFAWKIIHNSKICLVLRGHAGTPFDHVTIYRPFGWSKWSLGVDIDHFQNHCFKQIKVQLTIRIH